MPEGPELHPRKSTTRRLLQITWPLVATVVVLVVLASESIRIVSATRAYVGGESLWSKAQKVAVFHLVRYPQSRSEADYQAYRAEIAVTMGDRRARLELEKPKPDLAIVRDGFIAGRNDPEDIDGMIMLFRRFRNVSFMSEAIAIWAEGDERISELDDLAAQLHARIVGGDATPGELEAIVARIDDVNRRLTPLEVAFSNTLGEASRRTQTILEILLILTAALLVVGSVGVRRRMLRKSDDLEAALRVSEERFELAVAGSNAGVWDWNAVTNDVYFSPRYKELLGYADDEFPNMLESFLDHLHPDDRELQRAALHEHLTGETEYDEEFRLRTRSGDWRWFEARGRSVRNAQGEANRMAGSLIDITARKVAEGQLFAERDRAQVTLQSIGDAVITTDESGRVDYLNPVAEKLTGYPAPDARGKPLDDVLRIFEDSNQERARNPLQELMREERPVKIGGDSVLVRRDGGEFAIDASAAPICDGVGRIVGAVLVFNDVTRERRQAAQLAHQARHDALTGLVNRRDFEDRLSRALASAAEFDRQHAVLFIDLDHFKEVNDSCGHEAGDSVLREVSRLLQRKLRERDTLARLGGDEFAVLLENCAREDAIRIAETLRRAVAEFRFSWERQGFQLATCIGLVPISGREQSMADVLRAADASCYEAKHSGGNRVHVHDAREDGQRHHG